MLSHQSAIRVLDLGDVRITERIWWIVEGIYCATAHPGGTHAISAAVPFVREILRGTP